MASTSASANASANANGPPGPQAPAQSKAGPWEGQIPSAEHPADPTRYHLYIGWFCPFAHRVTLARHLKGLQDVLPMSAVRPYPKNDGGWRFPAGFGPYEGSTEDHLFDSRFLHDVYFRSPPHYAEYTGRYTVPMLWDKQSACVVNNESEQIARMLNTCFNDAIADDTQRARDFYPPHLRKDIDDVNAWLVPNLNAGVYKASFAADQESYERACRVVFDNLDRLEALLAEHGKPYILGDAMTELDFKAYATLIRFDIVYVRHFKVNLKTIRHDYPCLHRYLKNLYWNVDGFRQTTDFRHIKDGYFKSHNDLNPGGIVPLGPEPHIEAWTEEDEKWRQSWSRKE